MKRHVLEDCRIQCKKCACSYAIFPVWIDFPECIILFKKARVFERAVCSEFDRVSSLDLLESGECTHQLSIKIARFVIKLDSRQRPGIF
ncbi:hypothetical protein WK90_20830 [Burkholderia cepacia]|nr:hypothetical protein WK83_30355 [Burkholderia cepacia]KVV81299.1 hypothetical protein WK87_26035 [Burkholderia cepacia]KVW09208.1 hypothetical protein WK90_20830 [Burkholderia cepacia]KVW46328.1 hypothetical protein WK97_04240 [Burkholderia cepacia]KVZ23007.1 hypothetical protein WL14_14540 [Burkholderia cepacia]